MRFRRKKQPEEPDTALVQEQEIRLASAETRANVLVEKANWLYAIVVRRDQENHWQESVNELFLGGRP